LEIKLCGVGGQGMGLAGRRLGQAAILAGLHATETTAYGVESRGGLSNADVIISPDLILFPEIRRPDLILLMAEKGLKYNLRGAHEKTLILFDPGTVHEAIDGPGRKVACPFLEIALNEFNDRDAAMIIALGTLVEISRAVPWEQLEEAVEKGFPTKAWEGNRKALARGKDLTTQ
jgi:2-oxoglutarate ferredoxin oxidoreductase subunit gamma